MNWQIYIAIICNFPAVAATTKILKQKNSNTTLHTESAKRLFSPSHNVSLKQMDILCDGNLCQR